jgi:hypothetical protein
MLKLRIMGWAGYVASIREIVNSYKNSPEVLKERQA